MWDADDIFCIKLLVKFIFSAEFGISDIGTLYFDSTGQLGFFLFELKKGPEGALADLTLDLESLAKLFLYVF